jgi:hypothetical protein
MPFKKISFNDLMIKILPLFKGYLTSADIFEMESRFKRDPEYFIAYELPGLFAYLNDRLTGYQHHAALTADNNGAFLNQPLIRQEEIPWWAYLLSTPYPIQITHLTQTHAVSNMNPNLLERVARSQLEVAKYLLKYPRAMIFEENCFSDYTPAFFEMVEKILAHLLEHNPNSTEEDRHNFAASHILHILVTPLQAAKLFSLEFPNIKFDDLKLEQKKVLAYEGGARILFYLKKLPQLYRGTAPLGEIISPVGKRRIADGALDRVSRGIFIEKEEVLLDRALRLAIKNGMRESEPPHAIFVLGGGHNLAGTLEGMHLPFSANITFEYVQTMPHRGIQITERSIHDHLELYDRPLNIDKPRSLIKTSEALIFAQPISIASILISVLALLLTRLIFKRSVQTTTPFNTSRQQRREEHRSPVPLN